MALPQYDFNRICRTCKEESNELIAMFGVSENADESPRIDEMLMACISLQANANDGLPHWMCTPCLDRLKNAYNFKQQCLEAEHSLKTYMKLIKNDDIKQEHLNSDPSCTEPQVDLYEEAKSECPKADYIEMLDNNQMILTCRCCSKVFTTIDGLRSHRRIHLGTLFECRFCTKGYTRQTHLYRHELSHGKHKLHVCRICNKTLTRMEHLKRHLTTHLKEKPFSCKFCNRGFNRSDHLDVHSIRCKGERVFICDICNRGFSREDSLEVHKQIHENQKPCLPTLDNIDDIEQHYYQIDFDPSVDNLDFANSDIEDYFEPQIEVTEDEEIVEKSEECIEKIELIPMETEVNDALVSDTDSAHSEYLPAKERLVRVKRGRGRPRIHPVGQGKTRSGRPRGRPPKKDRSLEEKLDEEKEGEFACSTCEELFTKMSTLEKHMKSEHGVTKVHTCKVCHKEFSRFNHMKRHMNSHSVVRPFVCDICTKRFSRRDHLRQHMKLHDKKRDFECDICMKAFHKEDQLIKHRASKHNTGEKIDDIRYECNICLKTFTTEKYRDVHVKGHMGDKSFQCKTCEKCFLSKSHLTEHMKFHNEHSKKFLCSECGQRFIRNDYLVIHMRRHRGEKPFKCKFCGKGFPRTTDLTVHERYHTGEKTHLCMICGRGFGRAYNLTVHMRTHTGEKPYQCTYCEAAFAQGNDLKAHVRRHTGERFQCELCSESFLMGYLLTQHKRSVHGLNVVSNIRRLQPANQIKQDVDDPPPITIPLPKPVVPDLVMSNIQAHLAVQLQHQLTRE